LGKCIINIMADDDFTKLFKCMTERFDKIDKTLEEKANREPIQKILDALDAISIKSKRLMMTRGWSWVTN